MAWRSALLISLCVWSGACTSPTHRIDRYAGRHGFESDKVEGNGFQHRVYRANLGRSSGVLHVYIEGDGTPFSSRSTVAEDPTPRDPVMLRLMALDPSPSLYLGRPCYFDLYRDAGCSPVYWTTRRFSPEVVDSLTRALLSELARPRASQVELYGHSGGATLAVLLAERTPGVTRVVTIGANLDINAWTALHGYSPLTGSLNPAELRWQYLPPPMLHLVGSADTNTPPALIETVVASGRIAGRVQVINGYTHNCCWEEIWPGVLSEAPGDVLAVSAAARH